MHFMWSETVQVQLAIRGTYSEGTLDRIGAGWKAMPAGAYDPIHNANGVRTGCRAGYENVLLRSAGWPHVMLGREWEGLGVGRGREAARRHAAVHKCRARGATQREHRS